MNSNAPEALQRVANFLAWAAVATYAVAFVTWNSGAGEAPLVFWWGATPQPWPVVAVVLAGFLCGLLVTWGMSVVGTLRRTAEQRALHRRIAGLEAELKRLRNLPIEEDLHAPPEPQEKPDDPGTA